MQENVVMLMDLNIFIANTSDLLADDDCKAMLAIGGLEEEAVSRICEMAPIKRKKLDRRSGYLFIISILKYKKY